MKTLHIGSEVPLQWKKFTSHHDKHNMNEYVYFFLIWWPKLIMDEKYLKIQMIKGPAAFVRDVEVWELTFCEMDDAQMTFGSW